MATSTVTADSIRNRRPLFRKAPLSRQKYQTSLKSNDVELSKLRRPTENCPVDRMPLQQLYVYIVRVASSPRSPKNPRRIRRGQKDSSDIQSTARQRLSRQIGLNVEDSARSCRSKPGERSGLLCRSLAPRSTAYREINELQRSGCQPTITHSLSFVPRNNVFRSLFN